MFTKATKNFGCWKEDRKENIFFGQIRLNFLLFSLSMCAFVFLILFVIVVKYKQEFYFTQIPLVEYSQYIPKHKKSAFLFEERSSSIEVLVSINSKNEFKFFFDDGKIVSSEKEVREYLAKKRNRILITSMFSRILTQDVARVKIWTTKDVSFEKKRRIMKIFSEFGFDDFDFALSG